MKVHPVYHKSLLEPYRESILDPLKKQIIPEAEEIDGETNWVVRDNVESRRNNRKKGKPVEYLVLWEGYADEDRTWEVYEHRKGTVEEALKDKRFS